MVDPVASFTVGGETFDVVRRATTPVPGPVPVAPNLVRIGQAAYPLAGIDPTPDTNPAGFTDPAWAGRGADQLVAFKAPLAVTPTNQWGAEVQVAGGRLAGPVVDRQVTGSTTGTPVPAGGLVLSANGKAREWLLRYAVAGAPVEFVRVEAPAPVSPGIPATSGGRLPAWVCAGYWQQYEGPRVGTLTQEAPQYNLLFAAFATGGGGQAMTFRPYVQDDASFISEVEASKIRGALWSLSIGGGVKAEHATVLRTDADAARCFNALRPIIDRYGFQGVDDDLENGPGGFTEAGLTGLFRRLRDHYGPGFVLSSTPRPYEAWRIPIAANLYRSGLLDLLQWQFYDALQYRDAAYLRDRAVREVGMAAALGVPLNAQVVGCITRNGYQYGWNTVAAYRKVVEELRRPRTVGSTQVPGLRGTFVWETNMDRAEGWSFARTMGALGASA